MAAVDSGAGNRTGANKPHWAYHTTTMTEIDESELQAALESVEAHRETLEAELFYDDGWMPAMYRSGDQLSLAMQTMDEELSDREMKMFRLGRVEARARVTREISDRLLDD